MARNIKWYIKFYSNDGDEYYINIYEDGYEGSSMQLTAGPNPFVTDEDNSEDFFKPIRPQTGTIQICTALPGGGLLKLDDILPSSSTSHSVKVFHKRGYNMSLEWQGFLSCEAYSQDYVGVPQVLSLNVISVLEAMRSIPLSSYYVGQDGSMTIGSLIDVIAEQMSEDYDIDFGVAYSESCSDIFTKYIFVSQYFDYKKTESNGNISYDYTYAPIYDILEDVCKFMGFCLRETGLEIYFTRNWNDELGITLLNMSDLKWMGTGHQRTIMQGAKQVSVETKIKDFEVAFEMPICPMTGLTEKILYASDRMPRWYYDKCTSLSVGTFTSYNISKCFLAYFYGIRNESVYPWDNLYEDIGFSNALYLDGKKYEDSTYVRRCVVKSIIDFSVICGVSGTLEDVGHFVLKIEEKTQTGENGYIRCGMKFLGVYYHGVTGSMWTSNANTTFLLPMSKGKGEMNIEIPRFANAYSFGTDEIQLYIYDDFDIDGGTSAIITDMSIGYEPPFKRDIDNLKENRYIRKLNNSRDEVSIQLNLASSFGNQNGLSHIYGLKTYRYGQDEVDYYEPITSLSYILPDNTRENRRPEEDLLNRLAEYYSKNRRRIELDVAHIDEELPLIKLQGINDGKVYLPLAESRDWKTGVCKLTCFETPT